MRVTITKPNVPSEFGITFTVGQTYTVGDDYGKSLVRSLLATDADGVLSANPNDPYSQGIKAPSAAWKEVLASTYTVLETDTKLLFRGACAVTVPAGFQTPFECVGMAATAGAVSLTAGSGATLLPGPVATSVAGAIFAIVSTLTPSTYSVTGDVA